MHGGLGEEKVETSVLGHSNTRKSRRRETASKGEGTETAVSQEERREGVVSWDQRGRRNSVEGSAELRAENGQLQGALMRAALCRRA